VTANEYTLFSYGLMYIFVAILSFSIRTIQSQKNPIWFYFGLFAALRAMSAWIYASNGYFQNNVLLALSSAFFATSFICLAEYAIKYSLKNYKLGPAGGRWIFIVLIILTSLGYFLHGISGLVIFTKYIWSAFLATASFILIFRDVYYEKNNLQKNNLLLLMFFVMIICSLGQIVVPAANFFPASLINEESFLKKTIYLNVYLNRAIVSAIAAILLWFFYTGIRPIRKRYRFGFPAIFFAILYFGWFITNILDTNARFTHERLRTVKAETLSKSAIKPERIYTLKGATEDLISPVTCPLNYYHFLS
jgi:hypothetical protein